MRWSDVHPRDIAFMKEQAERRLSVEEFDAYVNHPTTEEERENVDGLLSWFARRYPTPADRLRYARIAYQRWSAFRKD